MSYGDKENPRDIIRSLERENAKLADAVRELREACRHARDLYDQLATGSLEAAVKHGPNYEPPTDEDCLEVRKVLEEAIRESEDLA